MLDTERTRDRRRPAGATGGTVLAIVVGGVALVAAGFWAGRAWNTPVVAPGEPQMVAAAAPSGEAPSVAPDRARANRSQDGSQADPPANPQAGAQTDAHAGHDHGPAATAVAPFEFDPPQIDFGAVGPDTEMRGSFLVRNVTESPLTILKMAADCKCTTVQDMTGTIIPPGESVEVTAVMEGRPTPGTKKSEIRFVFSGYPTVASVPIFSAVVMPINADPAYILPETELAGETSLRASDGRAFRILSVNGETPVYAGGFDPAGGEARSEYTLRWDLTAYDPRTCRDAQGNRMPRWWVVETDHPHAPVVDLQVRHAPCTLPEPLNGREWVLNLTRAQLSAIPVGESVEFTAYLKWLHGTKPNDTIRQVVSESDQFDAELVEAVREDDKITCRVRVTPKAGHLGLMIGDVRFHGYTPGQSQRLAVIGKVVEGERQASRR